VDVAEERPADGRPDDPQSGPRTVRGGAEHDADHSSADGQTCGADGSAEHGTDGSRTPVGAWVSLPEAARRLGVTTRAIRGRIRRGTLESRPRGNTGREVYLLGSAMATLALADRAVLPQDVSGEVERLRAELADTLDELAEVRVALARAEGQLAARAEVVDSLRADRDRLVAEVADLRRPWLARLLDALRQRRTSPGL
jgi:hypothetical protein